MTSDKDLLRESVAHSVARQSASELLRKTQGPSLKEQTLKLSLRERERRELPIAHERGCGNAPEETRALRKGPTPATVQSIDLQKPSHEQKQEHSIEPGHYYGISR
ncbi:MAG: hypothetical protein WB729_09015 [Candidatus Sulfotelmatobacter sp.]